MSRVDDPIGAILGLLLMAVSLALMLVLYNISNSIWSMLAGIPPLVYGAVWVATTKKRQKGK